MGCLSYKTKIKYLIIIFILYYACFLFHELWIEKDAAMYLLLAKSLAHEGKYVDNFLPVPKTHTRIPPGYPFILSLVIRTFGDRLLFLRLPTLIFVGFSLIILFKILSKYLPNKEIVLILVLIALNPFFLTLVHTINSDILYLLLSWLGIFIFLDNEKYLNYKKTLLVTLIIIAGFYIKTNICLYFSLAIYLLLRKRYRHFSLVILLGLTMLPWLIYALPKADSYTQVFFTKDVYSQSHETIRALDIPWRFFLNLGYYVGKDLPDLLFYPYFKRITFGNLLFPVKIGLGLLFSFLFLQGFYFLSRRKFTLIEVYIFVYFTSILFWPYHDERFLFPIYPFLLVYLIFSLSGKKTKPLGIPIILCLLAPVLIANFQISQNLFSKKTFQKLALSEAYSWLKTNTSPAAIIMSRDCPGVYFYTMRKGLSLESKPTITELKTKKIDYILIEKETGLTSQGKKINDFDKYLKPLFEKYPNYFSLVYTSSAKPEVFVYRTNFLY